MKKILLFVLLMVGIIGGAQITHALPLEGVSVNPSRVAVSFDAATGMVRGSFAVSMTSNSNQFGCISLPGTTIRLGGSSDIRLSELASYCNWGPVSINVSFSTPYTNTQKGEYTFQIGSSRGAQTGSQPVTIAVPGFELRDVGSVTAINPHNEKITGDYEQSGYVYYFDQTRKALGEEVLFRSTGVYRQPPQTSAGNGKLWVVGQNTDLKVGNYIEGKRITSVDWGKGATCYVNRWNDEQSCTNPTIWVGEITTDTTTGGSLSFQFGSSYRLQELKISTPPVTKDFSITVGNAEVPLENKQLLLGSSRHSVNVTFPVSMEPISGVSCSDISLSAVGNSQFIQGVQSSVTKTGSCTGTVSGTISNVWLSYIKYPPYQIENKMTNEDLNLIESQAITVTGIVGATQKKDSGGVSFKKPQGTITIVPAQTSYEFSESAVTGDTVRIPVTITTKNISGTVTVNRPDVDLPIRDYIDASYNPSITTMDGNSSKTVDLVIKKTDENITQSTIGGGITLSASGGGISSTEKIRITIKPKQTTLSCVLSASSSGNTAPQSVFISAQASGGSTPYTYYIFEPGSGNTVIGAGGSFSGTYVYSAAGTYTAKFIVYDRTGKSAQCSSDIVVGSQPKPLSLSLTTVVSKQSMTSPLWLLGYVTPTGGSGRYSSYSINFGNGTVSGLNVGYTTYTTNTTRTYTIKGTVVDSSGATASASKLVTVYPAGTPATTTPQTPETPETPETPGDTPGGTDDPGSSQPDLCANVTCGNTCSGTTLKTGGTCNTSTGTCNYSSSQSFSTSCGYTPISCTITSSKLIGLPPFKPTLNVLVSGGTGSYTSTIYPTGSSSPSYSGTSYAHTFTVAGTYSSYARVSDKTNPSDTNTCSLPVPITVYGSTGGETNP